MLVVAALVIGTSLPYATLIEPLEGEKGKRGRKSNWAGSRFKLRTSCFATSNEVAFQEVGETLHTSIFAESWTRRTVSLISGLKSLP